MLDVVQYDDIKKYKRYFTTDLNTNSKLYFDKDVIHKIPHYIEDNYLDILEYIDKLDLDNLIKLKAFIYNKDKLIGYSFINHKDYKSLRKLKSMDFKLKKQVCFNIMSAYNILKQNNIKYVDFHLWNVLVDPDTLNVKICDLDEVSVCRNERKNNNLERAFMLSLAFLYNISYNDIRNVIEPISSYDEGDFISMCARHMENFDRKGAYELIEQLTPLDVVNEREKIINKSKQLCNLGYRRFYR